jgi:hypothetical protein
MLRKKMKNLTLIALILMGCSYGLMEANHVIVCLKDAVSAETNALRCRSHFERKTSDGYMCYVRFDTGKDIKLVVDKRDPSRVVPDELYGASDLFNESALATYEKDGLYPQALLFNKASNVNIAALVDDAITAEELGNAIGATPILYNNNEANFETAKSKLGSPFADCVAPKN